MTIEHKILDNKFQMMQVAFNKGPIKYQTVKGIHFAVKNSFKISHLNCYTILYILCPFK